MGTDENDISLVYNYVHYNQLPKHRRHRTQGD